MTGGYGILQPRVAVSLPEPIVRDMRVCSAVNRGSTHTRALSPTYTRTCSARDRSSAWHLRRRCVRARTGESPAPDRILSHDLLEGCYVRAGLLTDVQLYEEFPSRYSADVGRRHRWIRGDWQLGVWMLPRVPAADAPASSKFAFGLSRWKIFDNLRRSLVPAALVVLLLLGWTACLTVGSGRWWCWD